MRDAWSEAWQTQLSGEIESGANNLLFFFWEPIPVISACVVLTIADFSWLKGVGLGFMLRVSAKGAQVLLKLGGFVIWICFQIYKPRRMSLKLWAEQTSPAPEIQGLSVS